MNVSSFRRLAADVGFVIAPAGLNFVVPGTTWWLHVAGAGAVELPGYRVRALEDRIAFEEESLRANAPLLRTLDALWRARLTRAGVPSPRPIARRPLVDRLAAIAAPLRDELPLRAIVLRAAGVLEAISLFPAYHPRGEPSPGYLFDLLENGMCVLLIEPARSTD